VFAKVEPFSRLVVAVVAVSSGGTFSKVGCGGLVAGASAGCAGSCDGLVGELVELSRSTLVTKTFLPKKTVSDWLLFTELLSPSAAAVVSDPFCKGSAVSFGGVESASAVAVVVAVVEMTASAFGGVLGGEPFCKGGEALLGGEPFCKGGEALLGGDK